MNYALEVDAADVLGVSPGATLQEIHDAYRTRVKKHHPDVGGDDWAFRAVARAYEILSHARVRARGSAVNGPGSTRAKRRPTRPRRITSPSPPPSDTPPPPDHESSWVRAGVEDRVDHPSKVVDVELFTIRYELSSPLNLLQSPKDRNLSSCLNIHWPAPPLHDGDPEPPPRPEALAGLKKAFAGIPRKTRATASWSTTRDGRFSGWISYPTATQAGAAFESFHAALKEQGLGVRHSTRELFIARESR